MMLRRLALSLDRSATRWLLGIAIAGVAVRLVWCAFLPDELLWSDEHAYETIGQNIARHAYYSADLGHPTAFRAPGQPFFLAGVYLVAGAGRVQARVAQSLLWGLALVLAYAVARALGASRRAAVLASAMACAYPYYVYAAGTLFPLTLLTVLLLAATWLLLRLESSGGTGRAAFAGALLGAGALAVPYAILTALAVPFWLGRRRLRDGLIVVAAALVVVAPWLARNVRAVGAPVMTTNAWLNFWYGNNDRATASSGSDVEIHPAPLWERFKSTWPDELAMEAILRESALAYVREHPGRTAKLWFAKAVNFYRFWPETQTKNVHTNALTRLAGAATFGPVLLLGLWGWWRFPQKRRAAIIAAYFAAFTLVAAVTISKDRFRMPLDVYLMVFAGIAIDALLARIESRAVPRSNV